MTAPASRSPRPKKKKRRLLPSDLGAILEITRGEDKGRKTPLVFARTVIGRKAADVLVRDIKVSSTHMAITFTPKGFRVTDLGSSNGTFVEREKVREADLAVGQEVQIGESAFRIGLNAEEAKRLLARNPVNMSLGEGGMSELINQEFLQTVADDGDDQKPLEPETQVTREVFLEVIQGAERGRKYKINKPRMVIGRVEVDINISDKDISRKHAMLERQEDNRLLVRDLASTNGTFVNERQVSNCVVKNGDHIKVGQTTLLYTGG